VTPDEPTTRELQRLLGAGDDEPVAHHLFREAWVQRHANRRSALVIGVAALEVGIKQYIGKVAPDAKWLAENAPSPPVKKMLRDYLPLTPAVERIGERVAAPPRSHLDEIEAAVTARNSIVHVGRNEMDFPSLESKLVAIRDVLWLLDYYSGATWALEHVSAEMRAGLELPPA
jgi:hypothetical protein